jgi:hypothetical protein
MRRWIGLVALLAFGGCGYDTLVTEDEAVDAAWSEVDNQLQAGSQGPVLMARMTPQLS